MRKMNNQGFIPSIIIYFIAGGGVSIANILEVLQPAVGIAVGLCTLIGAIIIIRVNLVRLKNLRLDGKIKEKQLNGLE